MLRIDELMLRVPGLTQDEGQRLGDEVAQRLATQWPAQAVDQQIGELTVRLTAPPNVSPSQLAEAIADQILEQLRFATL